MTRFSSLPFRGALGALAVLLLHAPTRALAQETEALAAQRTRAQLEVFFGMPALRCIASSGGLELCEWDLASHDPTWKPLARSIDTHSRIAVLCEVPADGGARAPGSCSLHPRRSDQRDWAVPNLQPSKSSGWTVADRRAARERLAQRAEATLEQARTMSEISRLVGAVPDLCAPVGPELRSCLWRATSRTLGHGMLAATISAPSHKKLRLECSLPADGAPRPPGSCKVAIGV